MEKHLQHESTGLFVSGIGGRGEIEFIKHEQMFNGMMILYHGITDMLRVGDFSVYALGAGIVGLGEIKTNEMNTINGKALRVHAHISSKIKFSNAEMCPTFEKEIMVPPEETMNFQHLNVQLSAQDELLIRQHAEYSTAREGEFEYDLINQLKNEEITINADKSMLLFSIKEPSYNLSDILLSSTNPKLLDKSLIELCKMIELPNSKYNRYIVGTIDTAMTVSRIPLFWWHIENSICADLYFDRIKLVYIYNPAKLIQHYCSCGFTVSNVSKSPGKLNMTLSLHNNKTCVELNHFESYFNLITQSLLKTKNVTQIIDSVISDIRSGKYQKNTMIDLRIRLSNLEENSGVSLG